MYNLLASSTHEQQHNVQHLGHMACCRETETGPFRVEMYDTHQEDLEMLVAGMLAAQLSRFVVQMTVQLLGTGLPFAISIVEWER